jgi:ribosomal protein S18 acetylase RimI-like enzyme
VIRTPQLLSLPFMLEFPSIVDYGLERAAETLTRAFADYFVSIKFSVGVLLQTARMDSVDLAASRMFVRDGAAVGAALIARRGWTSRLAGMAIVPEARRAGIGRAAVTQLLADARARKDRAMVLEAIEQNSAAVELYRGCGFREIRRLVGFAGPPPPKLGPPPLDLVEVDPREVANAVIRYGLPDLPWQISGETIAQLTSPNIAYRLNGVWVALLNPENSVVTLRGLIAETESQGAGREAALLRAVMAKRPDKKEWRITETWPEELADVIIPAGLPRTELTQWQMQCEL